ncbi:MULTISPECIES: hypothetical protein [Bartonella]|uniref:Uncharacterized protein n=1 Tax=Bartonella rochalimae ATCC BAA-1498 TaxID=685782 RepID=A0A067W5M8_9HYPH|nr:hypothetical protein [Bartonella rochalimae]AQX18745.1 hypothetical protein BA1379B_009240 [Bartonella sp. A1379B]AQX23259.1 hypothetical protein Bho11B_012630 [Bartonella sp. 11B]AQX23439.1 hypothetical protein Bho114_000940 [Bartonella sp. 114]AQX25715.1 hypothetical protein Bco22_010440 [Bartonella sp. Coyote22sub2]KEC54126.1 hypothetical protein O99_01007 [Bartonella rochalimae ATCC BAA-1498]
MFFVQDSSDSEQLHLPRCLLEQSSSSAQQRVINPEGDFVTLASELSRIIIESQPKEKKLIQIAHRIRQY